MKRSLTKLSCLKFRKTLSFSSLLVFFILAPSAQSFSQPFSGGFFAGMSASQVDGDTYSGYNKAGITAGGYVGRDISRNLSWVAELRYIQKGAFKKVSVANPDYYRLAIHYVELPIMLRYFINDNLYIEGGLSPDVYMFHNEEDEFGDVPRDEGPDYHRFGLNAGGGAGYLISDRLGIALRNSYSVIPMRDHASGQTWLLNRGQYNNVLSVALYLHFD